MLGVQKFIIGTFYGMVMECWISVLKINSIGAMWFFSIDSQRSLIDLEKICEKLHKM